MIFPYLNGNVPDFSFNRLIPFNQFCVRKYFEQVIAVVLGLHDFCFDFSGLLVFEEELGLQYQGIGVSVKRVLCIVAGCIHSFRIFSIPLKVVAFNVISFDFFPLVDLEG